MGTCTAAKKKQYEFKGDEEPQDTESWNLPDLPSVETQIKISNLKLKNVPYPEASAIITIPHVMEVKLQRKKGPKNIKWTFEQVKRVRLTEYELRKKFVFVSVFHNQVKTAQMKLNLYLIATGPYHLDFSIRYTNKAEGRFSLDVRISQLVPVIIESKQASVQFLVDRPGESFSYSIRSIVNAFKDTESEHSSMQKLSVHYQNRNDKSRPGNNSARQSTNEETSKVVWAGQLQKLPSVKSTILGSKVPNACLQFLLWTVQMPSKEVNLVNLLGECYVSYNKLLKKEFALQEKEGRPYEIHDVDVKEKLWYHGKHTADLFLSLRITIPKFPKQMVVYVRTEEGVMKTSPVIVLDAKAPQCQELAELIVSKDSIQEDMTILAELSHQMKPSLVYKVTQLRGKVQKQLSKQLTRLQISEKQSAMMYNYRSEQEILKTQQVFLDIGFRLLYMIQDEDPSFRDTAFSCLVALMKRGELSLLYMGFRTAQKQQIERHHMSKLVKGKYQNAVKMQNFLYQILKIVLGFLNQKALQQNQRVFVEIFSAFSYFRVPEFRQRLLSILTKPDDPQIVEWRGTQYSLEKDETPTPVLNSERNSMNNTNTFSLLFDWQSNFYDVIADDERYKQNQADLFDYIDNQPWRHRMEKRGIGFFFFIIYWVKYVETIAVISDNVRWNNIPGYTQLLKALLCEMKRRPVIDYPDSLVEASVKMLANEKLLNPYVAIVFNKTNMFDSNTVMKTIELINTYFEELEKNKKTIPTSFNYNVFLAGIKTIITSDNSFAIAKSLLLYYNHYNMLNFNIRKDFNMFLLGRMFFKLFLNWSINVRMIFHHLIVFRIFLQSNIVRKDKAEVVQHEYAINEEITRRYVLLTGILESAKEKREEDDNQKFAYGYEKDYYKKMRKKLQEQKRAGVKNPHFSRKETITDPNKYTLDELVKAPHLRMRSEALGVKVSYDKPLASQTDLYQTISQQESNSLSPFVARSSKKIILKRLTSHQDDFQIAEINVKSLQYLSKSLAEFKDIEEKYEKFFTKNTEKDPVPEVTVKVPIDEVELRPFHIDEW